jgi:ketosteroid isomerase-like protein
MKADAKTEKEVMVAWLKFLEAYSARDIDSILAMISSDPAAISLGTGVDERRIGLKEIKDQVIRDWTQSEAANIEITWSQVSAAGAVAWIASDGIFKAKISGKNVDFPCRLSAVFQKQKDKWLMMQLHLSFIEAGQIAGESFPAGRK